MLPPEIVLALAAQCAPGVEPATLLALARAESALDPLAIGVNGPRSAPRPSPRSPAEATATARALTAAGRDLDLGLAQINVRNLPRLGLRLEDAFDPCRNLAAAGRVLRESYARAAARHGPGQVALRTALSYYNTGHARRGFANGYVARVLAQAGVADAPPPARPQAAAGPPLPAAPPPAWDAFARAGAAPLRAGFVVSPAGGAR